MFGTADSNSTGFCFFPEKNRPTWHATLIVLNCLCPKIWRVPVSPIAHPGFVYNGPLIREWPGSCNTHQSHWWASTTANNNNNNNTNSNNNNNNHNNNNNNNNNNYYYYYYYYHYHYHYHHYYYYYYYYHSYKYPTIQPISTFLCPTGLGEILFLSCVQHSNRRCSFARCAK